MDVAPAKPPREAKTEEVRLFAESMRGPLLAAIKAGGDTDRKVAVMLNKQKLTTRTGDRWTLGGIKYLRMLLGIPRQAPRRPIVGLASEHELRVSQPLADPAGGVSANL